MKKLLGIIIVVALTLVSVKAQQPTVSSHLPIRSQSDLREYALDQVVRGFRSVNAGSIIWSDDQRTWVETNGLGAEDVLDKLFQTPLTYNLSNPDDKIRGLVWLYDRNDILIFFGSASYLLKDLDRNGPSYSIWMQRIPLLDGVDSAEVLALDEDGVTARKYQLDIDEYGHILFNEYMAGSPNGILSVRFKDGTVSIYNLWDPVEKSPSTNTEGDSSWKIDGHHVIKLSPNPVALVKVIEPWTLPTILITVGQNQNVSLDILGLVQVEGQTFFERPVSFTHTQIDGPWAGAGIMPSGEPLLTRFPVAGKYRIKFEWNRFGQPNRLYTGPENPGKG